MLSLLSPFWEFISWKYSGMNLTRSSSRASACRKWQAWAAEADVERKTSPLESNRGDRIPDQSQLLVVQWKHERALPYSDKMDPQVFAGKRVLELPRDLPCLRLSRTDCSIVIPSPVQYLFVKLPQTTVVTHDPICFSVGVLIKPT